MKNRILTAEERAWQVADERAWKLLARMLSPEQWKSFNSSMSRGNGYFTVIGPVSGEPYEIHYSGRVVATTRTGHQISLCVGPHTPIVRDANGYSYQYLPTADTLLTLKAWIEGDEKAFRLKAQPPRLLGPRPRDARGRFARAQADDAVSIA